MAGTVLAYEPVWAIGTGLTATPEQAQSAHAFIRARLAEAFGQATADRVVVQYGGSVKPDNAGELLACPDIDGALVGGASLKAGDFLAIVGAGRALLRVASDKWQVGKSERTRRLSGTFHHRRRLRPDCPETQSSGVSHQADLNCH